MLPVNVSGTYDAFCVTMTCHFNNVICDGDMERSQLCKNAQAMLKPYLTLPQHLDLPNDGLVPCVQCFVDGEAEERSMI